MKPKNSQEPVPTEEQEQAWLFERVKMSESQYPELSLMFHIPNGGLRSKSEAARFKRAGVKAGVPDIFLPVARGEYHGLFIELKRRKGGVVSENQSQWLESLRQQGYKTAVCHGWQEAWQEIERYLQGGDK